MRNLILSSLLAGSALALGACSYAPPESASVVVDGQTLTAEQARWREHIAILADDAMEGRLAGTPGYERAADYVVQQGVPSVFLWPGTKGPGKAAFDHFLSTHYHQASDQIDQQPNIDWASGVRFIEANFAITKAIADAAERPRWNRGDFFGTLYNGHGAE